MEMMTLSMAFLLAVTGVWTIFKSPLNLGKVSTIAIKRQHVQIYFPIVACLIVSIILSLLLTFLLNW